MNQPLSAGTPPSGVLSMRASCTCRGSVPAILDGPMILPAQRDLRLTTVRRGGTLSDAQHHLLALWAADCAEHVLPHFETVAPGDLRPRAAIGAARAWARGEIR